MSNNKKGKKGFTLIELLATIFVISLVFGIGFYYVSHIIQQTENKTSELSLANIKSSAILYAKGYSDRVVWSDSGTACVPLEELVNVGYLKQEQIDTIEDDKAIILTRNSSGTIISEEIDTEGQCGNIGNKIPIPTSKKYCSDLRYTAQELEFQELISDEVLREGFDFVEAKFNGSIVEKVKDVGEYQLVARLTDSENKTWSDNSTSDKEITCSIKKAVPELKLSSEGDPGNVGDIKTSLISSDVDGYVTVRSTSREHVLGTIVDSNKL